MRAFWLIKASQNMAQSAKREFESGLACQNETALLWLWLIPFFATPNFYKATHEGSWVAMQGVVECRRQPFLGSVTPK